MEGTIPRGYCQCGCGQKTNYPRSTDRSQGWHKDIPHKYIAGHQHRSPIAPPRYKAEDRGYGTLCWIWQGCLDGGYARARINGNRQYVHRYTHEKKHGKVPPDKQLDHLCFQKDCVNPDHTEKVTLAENSRRRQSNTLNKNLVLEIRETLASSTESCAAIGRRYGVGGQIISDIKRGRRWKGVGIPEH